MKIGIGNWARPFASAWRVVVFTLVVCATGQAWAAQDGSLNYTISPNGGEWSVVVDNTVKNGVGSFSAQDNMDVSGVQICIAATSSLPSGTKVNISRIVFGLNSLTGTDFDDAAATITINSVTSSQKTHWGYDSFPALLNASGSTIGCALVYAFSDLILEVGQSYAVTFNNYTRIKLLTSTGANSASAFSGVSSTKILFQITGKVVEPIASSVSGDATWGSGDLAEFSTGDATGKFYLINVTEDSTITIPASTSVSYVTLNVSSGKTLNLASEGFTADCILIVGGSGSKVNISGTISSSISYVGAPTEIASDVNLGKVSILSGGSLALDAIAGVSATTNDKNLLQDGLNDQAVTVKGDGANGVSVSFDNNKKFTSHIVFDGGTHSVSSVNSGQNYTVCDNSSNSDPMWTVKADTVLNFTGKDFGGYQGSGKANTCVIAAENGATINLSGSGSSTFYASHRWFLNPGSQLNVNLGNNLFRVIGGTTSGQQQFWVPSGSGTATIGGTGNIFLATDSTTGAGIFVGDGSTLAVNIPVKGAQDLEKRGAGTWKQVGSLSDYSGTLSVVEGTLAILNGLNINASASLKFSSGTVLVIEEPTTSLSSDGVVTLKVASDSQVPNVTVYAAGTTTPTTGVTASKSGTTLTISFNPTITGSTCWMDFEFNGSTASSGRASGTLKSWGSSGYVDVFDGGNSGIYMNCRSASDNVPDVTNNGFPSAWTAVMRCTAPSHNNDKPVAMLMCGSTVGAYNDLVGIVYTKEGKVKLATKDNTVGEAVAVHNAATEYHVYTLVKTASNLKLYVDGELKSSVDAAVSPAGRFQIGATYGGGSIYSECDNNEALVDYLRFFDCAAGENAISAITAENPPTSEVAYETTIDKDAVWGDLAWNDDLDWDLAGVGHKSVILNVTADSALTLPAVLKIKNIEVDVDNGATLTLTEASGGTEYIIEGGIAVRGGTLCIQGALPAPVVLDNGNLAFDIDDGSADIANGEADAYQTFAISGSGDVYKRGAGALFFGRTSDGTAITNTYDGDTYIEAGVARRGSATAFGVTGKTVYVRSGGVLDIFGGYTSPNKYFVRIAGEGNGTYPSLVQLSAANKNNGVSRLTLDADATIGGDTNITLGSDNLNARWLLYLNGKHLTKVGTGMLDGDNFCFNDDGVFEVSGGTFKPKYYSSRGADATLIVGAGANVTTDFNDKADDRFYWKHVVNNGTITADEENVLHVASSYSGEGVVDRLQLYAGAVLKANSETAKSVTSALTINDTYIVDVRELDLSSKSEDDKVPIITAPTEFDTDKVSAVVRGVNSGKAVLYSEESTTDPGTYILGVKVGSSDLAQTWNGSTGTWTDTAFNGGTDNYSNDGSCSVTFDEASDSATTAITVTVSGAKTVDTLAFANETRDITLSGDAISAKSIIKEGAGVSTIKNALATVPIYVKDGILVLNTSNTEVSAENLAAFAPETLVVYVGSGSTTTINGAITAKYLVKMGTGTLVLGAANNISSSTTIKAGTIKITQKNSSNETQVFGNGSVSIEANGEGVGGAIDVNGGYYVLNQLYLCGNGPDGNGAIINNVGDMGSGKAWKISLTGNASWGGSKYTHWGQNSTIKLNGYTLTKKGSNNFPFYSNTWTGEGTLVVEEGQLQNNSGKNDLSSVDVVVSSGGTLNMAAGTWLSVKNCTFESSAATVTAAGTASSSATLKVNGALTMKGTLTLPKLEMASGTQIVFGGASSALTVSAAFTLPASGTVEIDTSAITADSDGTVLISGDGVSLSESDLTKFSLLSVAGKFHKLAIDDGSLKVFPDGALLTTTSGETLHPTLLSALTALMISGDASAYVTEISDHQAYSDADLLDSRMAHDADGNYYKATVKIGTKGYKSLTRATEFAISGDTIVLLGDDSTNVVIPANVTVDCGTYSFTGTIGGAGAIKMSTKPATAPTFVTAEGEDKWTGAFIVNWSLNTDGTQLLFSQYGIPGSTVAITGMDKGYLSTQGNTEPLMQQNTIPATVRLDGNVKVTNGWQCNLPEEGSWPSATESNAGARQVIFSRLSGTGDFWCTYTGSSSNWGQSVNQHFVIQSLDGAYSGTLKIGKWFAVKLGAVDFAAEPAQNTKLIKVQVDNTEGLAGTFRNSANMNITQTGGLVDVTVNGAYSDTKLFLGDGGLYVAAASVTANDVTSYYPTLAAAKTAAGNDPATITLLADVSDDIELAYGQVLDTGTTSYSGTVSAADSTAKILPDGTTYKVVYGTIFSVW